MVFTRSELSRKNKGELFDIYRNHFNDEMSPIMWQGFRKTEILELMLNGEDEVDSPWGDDLDSLRSFFEHLETVEH